MRAAVGTSTVHTFDKSYEAAKLYDAELDKHFGQAYDLTKASRAEERRGIDRFFCHRQTGVSYSVEYKTDHKAHESGNVFIETMSVDTAGKRGWAYTSTAQVLVYFIPQREAALRADMLTVKRRLSEWAVYPERPAWNKSRSGELYRTLGLLVPLEVFRAACVGEHDVAEPLDALVEYRRLGLGVCIHELPSEICKVCNGTVRQLIEEDGNGWR